MNLLLSALFVSLCIGQADDARSPSPADLGPEYVDGTCGISLRPPMGWQLDRQRVSADGTLTLLNMFEPGIAGTGQSIELSMYMDESKRSIERQLARKVRAIELDQSSAEVLSQQVQTIAGKPGAVLSATLFDSGIKRFRMVAIIEVRSRQHFELTYDGPVDSKAAAERLFYMVLGSVRLLVDPVEEGEMQAALKSGMQWLSQLTPERLEKACEGVGYYEIRLKNEPIGVVRTEGRKHVWRKRHGVRLQECTWTFRADGTALRAQVTMFVSDDLSAERWKESITTLIPSREGRPETIENTWEEGLREGNILLTNQTYQLNVPPKENPPIRTPETYLPRGLARLLPRLLGDLDKPRRVAFTAFDHERAGLIVRTLELKGESPLPGGVSRGKTYRIEEREGVMAFPSVVYVDTAGHMLRSETGDLTVVAAEEKDVARLFGAQIRQAEAKMTELEKAFRKNERRFSR